MNRITALRFAVPAGVLSVIIILGAAWATMPGAVAPTPSTVAVVDPGDAVERNVAPVVGAYAPSFAADDLEGRRVVLDDLRGQVVLLNFWATW